MNRFRKSYLAKFVSLFLCLSIMGEVVFPTMALALTEGPSSPDFGSFTPVTSSGLVDPLTGSFNYSIPLITVPGSEGGGYSMGLSYSSGVNSEQEASWVGLGWTLDPGGIRRNKRGFADDLRDTKVTYYNKQRPLWSITGSKTETLEISSNDQNSSESESTVISGSLSRSKQFRFSNQYGLSRSKGFSGGANVSKTQEDDNNLDLTRALGLNVGTSIDQMGTTYHGGLTLSFSAGYEKKFKQSFTRIFTKVVNETLITNKLPNWYAKAVIKQNRGGRGSHDSGVGGNLAISANLGLGTFLYSNNISNAPFMPNYSWTHKFEKHTGIRGLPVNIGADVIKPREFSITYTLAKFTRQAYGYNYLNQHVEGENTQMDYYEEKPQPLTGLEKYIGMPVNNHDLYTVSASGLSGGFRAYHESVGMLKPANFGSERVEQSGSNNSSLGLDLTFAPSWIGIGARIKTNKSKTEITDVEDANEYSPLPFSSEDKLNYRFNGDMGGDLYYGNRVGSGAIIRPHTFDKEDNGTYRENDWASAGVLGGRNMQRAKQITYQTVEDVEASSSDAFSYLNKDFNNPNGLPTESVLEYKITDETGKNFVFGKPVYVKNETALSVNVNPDFMGENWDYDKLQLLKFSYEKHKVRDRTLVFRDLPLSTDPDGVLEVDDNVLKNENTSSRYRTVQGSVAADPFAQYYLISEITSPGYIDRTNDGPSDDDFGGWTKFGYRQKYGFDSDNWYRYRSPYKGAHYNPGALSNMHDDEGSVSLGDKELYYLKTVETKTHIAFFITNATKWGEIDSEYHDYLKSYFTHGNYADADYVLGTLSERFDSHGALKEEIVGGVGSATNAGVGSETMDYLKKVLLYSKEDNTKPIKVAHFEYSYELVKKLPNNSNSNYTYLNVGNPAYNSGKLTLKKLWFSYGNTNPQRISPYLFEYKYAQNSEFKNALNPTWFSVLPKSKFQNPDYDPTLLGPWGATMPFAAERKSHLIPWVYQGDLSVNHYSTLSNGRDDDWKHGIQYSGEINYDPAAWHLKRIKLPSGGEINVHYEENDYLYVQNRNVMSMASLLSGDNNYSNTNKYVINVQDLGCDPTSETAVDALRDHIIDYFKPSGNFAEPSDKKLFFKFLYEYMGEDPHLSETDLEYVEGYVDVVSVTTKDLGNGLFAIELGLGNEGFSENEGKGRDFVPRYFAYQKWYTGAQVVTGLNELDKSYPTLNEIHNLYTKHDLTVEEKVDAICTTGGDDPQGGLSRNMAKVQLYDEIKKDLPSFANFGTDRGWGKEKDIKNMIAKDMSYALSFVKLPMMPNVAKRGGGARVKRVFLIDASGMGSEEVPVYGQEYHYVNTDGYSSGVATNEPAESRDENPLIHLIGITKNSKFKRMVQGAQRNEVEGPVGESLLPSASIVYERVVIENINSEISNAGFTVKEFYTTKDYAYDYDFGNRSATDYDFSGKAWDYFELESERKGFNMDLGVVNLALANAKARQGFRFVMYDMNGKPKKETHYAGDYEGVIKDNNYVVAYTEDTYYEPGENLKMLSLDSQTGNVTVDLFAPGKEMDLDYERKLLKKKGPGFQMEFDVPVTILPPIAISFTVGGPKINVTNLRSRFKSLSKVLHYPVIKKKTKTYADGVLSEQEIMAFDAQSGRPLVIRSTDDFETEDVGKTEYDDGYYYSFNMPAHWIYNTMGSSFNAAANTNQLLLDALSLNTYDNSPFDINGDMKSNWISNSGQNFDIDNLINFNIQTYDRYIFRPVGLAEYYAFRKLNRVYFRDNPLTADQIILSPVFRPLGSYVPVSDQLENNTAHIFDKGFFNWNNPFALWGQSAYARDDNYVTNEITTYSPNGLPVEQLNALNMYSSVHYDPSYGNADVPVMTAQNAKYGDIFFTSYEDNGVENIAHSGMKSKLVVNGEILPYDESPYIPSHQTLALSDMIIRFWLKTTDPQGLPNEMKMDIIDGSGVNTVDYMMAHQVSSVNGWSLYETRIKKKSDFAQQISIVDFAGFVISDNLNLTDLYVDDLVIKPEFASSQCFVYDPSTLNLLAKFDDQHFGAFYKYNQKGELTHKLIETERGILTVEESRTNIKEIPQ